MNFSIADSVGRAELYKKNVGWVALPNLPAPLFEAGCAAYDEKTVFVVGGYRTNHRTATYMYDVETGISTNKAPYAHGSVVATVARVSLAYSNFGS